MLGAWLKPELLNNRLDCERYQPRYVSAEMKIRSAGLAIELLDNLRDPSASINNSLRDMTHAVQASGIPIIRGTNIESPWINLKDLIFIDPKIENASSRSRIKAGDIIVCIAGSLGSFGLVPVELGIGNINSSCARVRPSTSDLSYYLIAYFLCDYGQSALLRESVGSVQRHINLEDLPSVIVPVPNINVLKSIGSKVHKAERLREFARRIQELVNEDVAQLCGNGSIKGEIDIPRWVEYSDLSEGRLDAWFYRSHYLSLSHSLQTRSDVVRVGELCKLSNEVAPLSSWPSEDFFYFEIGGVDSASGEAVPDATRCNEAPSRAKYLIRSGDLLVSTVRPNLKAVALVSDEYDAAVCSSGFSVLRCREPETAAYIKACLTHDIATHQLMRWNTGATYPAIDRSVPLQVLIPNPGEDRIREIGRKLIQASQNYRSSIALIQQSKSDVEALIDGTLNQEQLLSEGEEIARWLEANPCPREQGQKI